MKSMKGKKAGEPLSPQTHEALRDMKFEIARELGVDPAPYADAVSDAYREFKARKGHPDGHQDKD